MKSVRFWVYVTAPVMLKLRVGQTLEHVHGGPTDEGYSWSWHRWTFDGQTIHAESGTDACDCDGRISHHSEAFCRVSDLRAGYREDVKISYPAWQDRKSSQRDYSAEAMNY